MSVRIQGWFLSAVSAVFLFGAVLTVHAAVTPEAEYKDQIKVRGVLQPLGENPFGEAVSLYNGGLSFRQVDVQLNGTGLPITIARSFTAGKYVFAPSEYWDVLPTGEFGDWDLNLPKISTLVAFGGSTPTAQWTPARCSQFAPPPTPAGIAPAHRLGLEDWWNGFDLIGADGDAQQLLKRSPANFVVPTMSVPGSSSGFPIVTQKHWAIGCLPQTSNNEPGEGFFAVSPSGVKYWFDRLVYSADRALSIPKSVLGGTWVVRRSRASLLVTRMEDRFGNALTYSYDGANLKEISASDGRRVSLQWTTMNGRPVISQVTAHAQSGATRVYTYGYQPSVYYTGPIPSLASVVLPDTKQWSMYFTGYLRLEFTQAPPPDDCENCVPVQAFCNINDPTIGEGFGAGAVMYHPSGLRGEFTITTTKRGRSYVPKLCRSAGGISTAVRPAVYSQASITKRKVIDGSTSQTWNYQYSPHNGSFVGDCTSCKATVSTTVLDPDGTSAIYTFSNRWGATDGQLQQTHLLSNTGTISRTITQEYASSSTEYPVELGILFQTRLNTAHLTTLAPLSLKMVAQLGDTYKWEALNFDYFGNPTRTKRSNSIAGQTAVQELVTYASEEAEFKARWVLGQVRKVQTESPVEKMVSEMVFDTNALPLIRKSFNLPIMNYAWNTQGQLATFTDGLGRPTSLGDYKLGIPRLITFADGTTQKIEVSDFAEVTSFTDERGSKTNYQYDSMSRLLRTDYPTGDVVAWAPTLNEYFVGGANVVRSTTGRKRTTTTLDAQWRPTLIEEIDTETGVVAYNRKTYDSEGRVSFESYPSTNSNETEGTNFSYDALGRLTLRKATNGDVIEAISYLPGNRKQVIDADKRKTTVTYQAFDSPEYSNPLQIDAPENRTTVFQRDVYGKVLSATQSGNWSGGFATATRTWNYDIHGRLCSRTEPETASTLYGYDSASQLIWEAKGQASSTCTISQPSGATIFGYDPVGRKTLDDYTGTIDDVSYIYDAAGNVVSVSNPTATWSYNYNKRNLLERESAVVDGKTLVLDPIYDALGNITSKTLPDGTFISYASDAWGRSTQLAGYVTNAQYHPTGQISAYSLANGLVYSQTLDDRKRPSVQQTSIGINGPWVQRFVYGYTRAGDINSVTEQVDHADDATFAYDGLHRVTTANGLWGSYGYVYDTLNNIRGRSGPNALAYNYNSTNNRLAEVSGGAIRSYAYNNNGEVTHDGARSFTLNSLGQVNQIAGIASYFFDGNGKRIKAIKGGVTEYALYDRGGAMVYSESGATKTNFLKLGQTTIELKNIYGAITATYLHNDWLGSPRKASDASGGILWAEHYEPFGKKMNGVMEKVGYTGHADDAESGLTYAQARYYDPIVGRFLSPDPVRMEDDYNLYAYVGNNPINATDPTGQLSDTLMIKALEKASGRYVASLITTQLDSPVPGPADAVGIGMAIGTTVGLLIDVGIAVFSDESTPAKADSNSERVASTDKAEGIERTSTLGPGPNAKASIPGHNGDATTAEQQQINQIGDEYGCHTCGGTTPGTKDGHWVVDHQEPRKLGNTAKFYPHCLGCSRRQGGDVRQEKRRREKAQKEEKEKE